MSQPAATHLQSVQTHHSISMEAANRHIQIQNQIKYAIINNNQPALSAAIKLHCDQELADSEIPQGIKTRWAKEIYWNAGIQGLNHNNKDQVETFKYFLRALKKHLPEEFNFQKTCWDKDLTIMKPGYFIKPNPIDLFIPFINEAKYLNNISKANAVTRVFKEVNAEAVADGPSVNANTSFETSNPTQTKRTEFHAAVQNKDQAEIRRLIKKYCTELLANKTFSKTALKHGGLGMGLWIEFEHSLDHTLDNGQAYTEFLTTLNTHMPQDFKSFRQSSSKYHNDSVVIGDKNAILIMQAFNQAANVAEKFHTTDQPTHMLDL